MVLFTDDFTGTDPSLGASWDHYSGVNGLQRVADTAEPDVVSAAVDGIQSHSGTLPSDQWAEATLATILGGSDYNSLGVGVRWAAPNAVSGYLLLLDSIPSGSFRLSIQKYTAAVLSQVTSSPSNFVNITLAGNDVFRLEAIGTLLRGFQNGVLVLSGAEASYAGGRAAVEAYAAATLSNAAWNSFRSGDFILPPPTSWAQLAPLLAH